MELTKQKAPFVNLIVEERNRSLGTGACTCSVATGVRLCRRNIFIINF